MKLKIITIISALVCHSLIAQTNHSSDVKRSSNLPNQFSNKSVTLTPSWIRHREELNAEYLRSLDADRLLHNFKINAKLPSNAKPLFEFTVFL